MINFILLIRKAQKQKVLYVTDGSQQGLSGETREKTCGAYPLREFAFSGYTFMATVVEC